MLFWLTSFAAPVAIVWALSSNRVTKNWLPQIDGQARLQTLDGLRAFLALSVVFAHSLSLRNYLVTQRWAVPPEGKIFEVSPEMAVRLFFCITGFLFWGKALRSNGSIKIWNHYKNRFLRIYPLYLFVVFVSLIMCLTPVNREPLSAILRDLDYLLTLTKVDIPINGTDTVRYLTQTWTLGFEFCFYLVLPALALIVKLKKACLPILIGIAVISIAFSSKFNLLTYVLVPFFIGMITAHIDSQKIKDLLKGPVGDACVIAGLLGCYLLHRLPQSIYLSLIFIPIANGASLFGLLSWKISRILGEISYSVYLLHLLVLNIWIRAWGPGISNLTLTEWWFFDALFFLTFIPICLVSYRIFEKPFMRMRVQPASPR